MDALQTAVVYLVPSRHEEGNERKSKLLFFSNASRLSKDKALNRKIWEYVKVMRCNGSM